MFSLTAEYKEDGTLLIHPGTYHYPVRFTLPMNLPSSYEANHGHVRYSLKAKVERSTFKFDTRTESVFTVICLYDLNQDETAMVCLSEVFKKLMGYLFNRYTLLYVAH